MSDPNSTDPRPPRLEIHGPRAEVPMVGGAGALPYAGGAGRRRAVFGVAIVVALLGAGGVALAVTGDDGDRASGPGPVASSTSQLAPSSTAAPTTATTSTTTAPTTTTAPVTTTTISPTAKIPVGKLPRHEAVYRDGKLILQGTVPSAAVAERFRSEAAAVIGAGNVIVRYQVDPRVPVPTDGRVRVDEAFLFPKNSATIDARYEPVMQLGVTVMKLNPQARMRINGYTDDSGSVEVNLRLSQARADALKRYLADHGVNPARIEAIGRGETAFVAPNDTEANRGRNRRIEVELLDLLRE